MFAWSVQNGHTVCRPAVPRDSHEAPSQKGHRPVSLGIDAPSKHFGFIRQNLCHSSCRFAECLLNICMTVMHVRLASSFLRLLVTRYSNSFETLDMFQYLLDTLSPTPCTLSARKQRNERTYAPTGRTGKILASGFWWQERSEAMILHKSGQTSGWFWMFERPLWLKTQSLSHQLDFAWYGRSALKQSRGMHKNNTAAQSAPAYTSPRPPA